MTPLISGLLKPSAYTHIPDAHPAVAPRLIETHISWVILVGDYAYKIKKPVNLGFLDFSSLEQRRHFCDEEIRLNRRLAPEIYLAVVPITGTLDSPLMNGGGEVVEWAVQMRAFPADATLDREASISAAQIDAIAEQIAAFHAVAAIAPANSPYGQPEAVSEPVLTNFVQLRALLPSGDTANQTLLGALQAWSETEAARLNAHFTARKADGFIRECHGDLHLGNIAWVEGKTLVFDALEFNPALNHIDVISEIAFLSMDLRHRGRDDLAWRLLNGYLELTGDYAGLDALPYYQVYRALVRAKVAAISAAAADQDFSVCQTYLQLADRLAHERHPALVLMHGVSGSGKTWLSQHLLEHLGGIRLRSDVTRKRLFGLQPLQDSATIPGGIYTQAASALTLAALLDDAATVLAAGCLTLVDATFIHRIWRAPFQALAEEMGVAWQIVALEAPAEVLHARITQRQQTGADASEARAAVLASQLANLEPFNPEENAHVMRLGDGWTVTDAIAQLRAALN
jgi:hypothetical protein